MALENRNQEQSWMGPASRSQGQRSQLARQGQKRMGCRIHLGCRRCSSLGRR